MYAHGTSSHIPQPPHSAGTPYKGLRAAIDPNQIPSPIETIEMDRERWENQQYPTLPGKHPPLSTTDFVAIDQGNSSPRFIRMSTWNIPSSSRLASECEVPIAAIIQPFAEQDPREEPIPVVHTGDIGPARCERCRAYINPWCTWVAGGARWRCNLCHHESEVVSEYFCNLDASLLRLDHLQRPELNKGTVDFVVPEPYWAPHPPPSIRPLYTSLIPTSREGKRKPTPLDYVFVLDASQDAVRSGFFQAACNVLLEALHDREDTAVPPYFPSSSRVAILVYDQTIHYYNLSSPVDGQPPLLVVPDVDDVFLPLSDGLFVNPVDSRDAIVNLLSALPARHEQTLEREAALGSALTASLAALAGRGGQVVAFAATLPTIGVGALPPYFDESSILGTDKERILFEPREETWKDLGEQCASEGIGVSMFLGMSRPIDIASIGLVASLSGGEIFFHPKFEPSRDARRLLTRTTVHSCTMRVRCSIGLRVSAQHGNFYENPAGDMDFGTMDADKTVSFTLEHARTLDDRLYAFIQSAILYTTTDGERRVRVQNMALRVVTLAGNVFQYADMDATVSHMLREAISQMTSQRIVQIQESLTERCALILYAYRKFCAASAAPTQLILPEAFRALPLFVLAMKKTKPLKDRNVTADVRNFYAHRLSSMSCRGTMHHLYPQLLALHDLNDEIALPDANGRVDLPSLMRDSHLFMESHGVYLIDNDDAMILWIGASVSPQLLKDLLDVDDINQVNPRILYLPSLQTRLATQVGNILANRFAQRGYTPKFTVARQNMDGSEIEFSDMLVEDQNNAAMSYLDYLCLVHKQIHTALTTGASLSSGGGFRSMPW
ncbi:sec24-like protein [Epithele typhae]|uniref:sec24-like protein n=1 Tax=Epithele typhae TaxID=378194 RepID=UPI0020080823|nr:sec24-like protein [Epithele typhae]KAH9917662.1 sec24-like protein [Epithele typhae]